MFNEMPKPINLAKKHDPGLVVNLSFVGQMSVWGTRLLAAGHRTNMDVVNSLISGFRKCNAIQAGSNLLFLMDVVFEGLTRNVEINCACNPGLNEDELNFLDLFSISQHFVDVEEKIESLDFLTDVAAKNAIPLFSNYGASLKDAGLILPVFKERNLASNTISDLMKPSEQLH